MQINGKELTQAQKDIFKAWDLAAVGTDAEKVILLNTPASPTYKALKNSVGKHEVIDQSDLDSAGAVTNFAIGGGSNSLLDRSPGEQFGWLESWNDTKTCNPSRAQKRIDFFDISSGTGTNAVRNRTHMWAKWQRAITVGEKLFVTVTTGGPKHDAASGANPAGQVGARGSWTNPDTMPIEGPFRENDLANVRA